MDFFRVVKKHKNNTNPRTVFQGRCTLHPGYYFNSKHFFSSKGQLFRSTVVKNDESSDKVCASPGNVYFENEFGTNSAVVLELNLYEI